jgi:protease-4
MPPAAWPPVMSAPVAWAAPVPPASAKGSFSRGLGAGAGAGIGLGAVIAIGMIVSSLVFGLIASTATSRTDSSLKTVWGAESAKNQIRAVFVTGTILADSSDGSTLTGGTYGYEVAREIDALDADDAAGLLLVLNTPGGSINGSKAMADAIARYQERTHKKVIAHVQGMSASGGMYTMAGADEIIADYGSLIGSIGVIYGPFERYKDVKAITGTAFTPGVETTGGIEQTYLTMGRDKDFGNPFRDMRKEERDTLMAGMQNVYDDFVNTVATGRDLQPSVITEQLGAHIFDPKTAIANGLIDSQMGIDEAYRHAATAMGVDPADTRVVTPAAPSVLEQLLGAEARVPGHALPLATGEKPAAAICGSTPRVLVYHGEPATACG